MSEVSDSEVRELAREILARDEYHAADGKVEAPNALVEMLDWFRSWMEALNRLYETDPLRFWLINGLLLLVLVALIAHIVWSVSRALKVAEPASDPMVESTQIDFQGQAEELAHQGEFLEAAHRLWLAFLDRTARSGWIRLRPEDTNRHVRAELALAGFDAGLRDEVFQLIDETERSWFRDRNQDPQLYERWQRVIHALDAATP